MLKALVGYEVLHTTYLRNECLRKLQIKRKWGQRDQKMLHMSQNRHQENGRENSD